MRGLFVILVAFALSISGASAQTQLMQASGKQPSGARTANISVNLAVTGATIPTNFIGISGEVGDFTSGYYQGTTGAAASYISLANLLGSNGVLRIGGSSSDAATAPTITSGMANALNSFMGGLGAGWTLIYGLDAVANDSASAASTASTIATAVGVNNVIFQFGNEPSINGFSVGTYQTMWNTYYTAVTAAVPGAKLAAIDDGFTFNYTTTIGGLTPGVSGLTLVTSHWYSYCRGAFGNLPSILISSPRLAGSIWTTNAALAPTKQRLSESNSICGRGQDGSSNRQMAVAWFITESITLLNNGWVGVNVHNHYINPDTFYNPFIPNGDNTFSPGAVFYGMYLLSKIQNQQIVSSAISGNANVLAIATKGVGGNANILLTNNDPGNPASVKPSQSSAWTTANVLVAQAADGGGCVGATFMVGGATIGKSGAWSGAPITINNGDSVQIPPCAVALIQIQP